MKLVLAETMDAGAGGGAPAQPEAARRPAPHGRRGRRRPAQPEPESPRPALAVPADRPAARRRPRAGRPRRCPPPDHGPVAHVEAASPGATAPVARGRATASRPDPWNTRTTTRSWASRERATQADIKKAFRKLAREHHPDRNAGDKAAEKRFKDVNEANAVLSDPDKRKQYDLLGANWDLAPARRRVDGAPTRSGRAARSRGSPGSAAGRRCGPPGGNVRYEFHTTGSGDPRLLRLLPDVLLRRAAAGAQQATGRGLRRRAHGPPARRSGPSFEDILGGMGLDGAAAGPPGGAGSSGTSGRSGGAGRPLEAPAELSLEEAYHGTSA